MAAAANAQRRRATIIRLCRFGFEADDLGLVTLFRRGELRGQGQIGVRLQARSFRCECFFGQRLSRNPGGLRGDLASAVACASRVAASLSSTASVSTRAISPR